MFDNQTILITGATGSWGHELVKQLLEKNPKEVRIFSRNESSQVDMQRQFFHPKLRFIIGDIKDKDSLYQATELVDYVFHLAALKHVPVCEDNPMEALKTNVLGTQNVVEAAIAHSVKKVVYISTDKAANPSNFYGLTKAMGERLIQHANTLPTKTRFVCVRGGNVLGTNGSVIHVFKHQMRTKGEIGITHKDMTRFFLTLEDAIKLLFKATYESYGGETFVMKMPTCRILDLAYVLMDDVGLQDVKIRELGIRPGEKMHELLFSEYESQNTVSYDENYYVILPYIDIPGLRDAYKEYKPVQLKNYISSEGLMTKEELSELLKKGGFLS